MKLSKLFLLMIFITLVSCTDVAEDLDTYSCETISSAVKCDSSCKHIDGVTVDYKVGTNSVIQIIKAPGVSDQFVYKGCTIIDEVNWNCDKKKVYRGTRGAVTLDSIYRMSDGKVISYQTIDGGQSALMSPSCSR